MNPFLKLVPVPKVIDNIYLEYEKLFPDCVHYSETDTYLDELYKDGDLTWFEFFKAHKKIEIEFSEVIEKINVHLTEQFTTYNPHQLTSFKVSQKRHFKTYLPKNRKRIIYNSYLVNNIASGDESILEQEYIHSEEEKKYLAHIYSAYESYYYKLEEDCNTLIEEFRSSDNSQMQPFPTETKDEMLKAKLGEYGFFELPMVKQLSEPNKQSLIELITSNEMPYGIAMFDYLGFLKHLKAKYLKIDSKLFKEISKWFEVVERTVSGNI